MGGLVSEVDEGLTCAGAVRKLSSRNVDDVEKIKIIERLLLPAAERQPPIFNPEEVVLAHVNHRLTQVGKSSEMDDVVERTYWGFFRRIIVQHKGFAAAVPVGLMKTITVGMKRSTMRSCLLNVVGDLLALRNDAGIAGLLSYEYLVDLIVSVLSDEVSERRHFETLYPLTKPKPIGSFL